MRLLPFCPVPRSMLTCVLEKGGREGGKGYIPLAFRIHVLSRVGAILSECYMRCLGFQDYVNSKPAPDCFLLAAQEIGVPPELCVGYEDAVLGLEAIK